MGGGYIVPEELEDAVRTGLEIVGQPVTVNLTPKLSDWIDGSVKPTIAGIYQRSYGSRTVYYCAWTGTRWLCAGVSLMHAARIRSVSGDQSLPWRGLAEDPSRGTGGAS